MVESIEKITDDTVTGRRQAEKNEAPVPRQRKMALTPKTTPQGSFPALRDYIHFDKNTLQDFKTLQGINFENS